MKRLIILLSLSLLFVGLVATNTDRASPLFKHISDLSSKGMSKNVWITSENIESEFAVKMKGNNGSRESEITVGGYCTLVESCTHNECTLEAMGCTVGDCTQGLCTDDGTCTWGFDCSWTYSECSAAPGCTEGDYCTTGPGCTETLFCEYNPTEQMECTYDPGCTWGGDCPQLTFGTGCTWGFDCWTSEPNCTMGYGCTEGLGCETPVTLSTFTALYDNGTASLNWVTQSESNNSGWNIYRGESEDSYEYGDVIQINHGLIAGAGTTSLPTEYNHTDEFDVVANTTYWYMLESVDYSGMTNIYGPISLTVPQDEGDNPEPPSNSDFAVLYQNYPNPFSSNTDISFSIMEEGQVEISIYDVKGRKIVTLLNQNISTNELVTVSWDGKDKSGMELASGIYIFKLETNGKVFTKKMTFAK